MKNITFLSFQLLLWTVRILPAKSKIYLKPINYYEPIPGNGPSSPSIMKPMQAYAYPGPPIIYPNTPREFPWVKNPRIQLRKKVPLRQQFVYYYPPLKPTRIPYTNQFPNIRTINSPGRDSNYYYKNNIDNQNIMDNNYQDSIDNIHQNNINNIHQNNNKVPKVLNYETNLFSENMEPQRGEGEVLYGKIFENRNKYHIQNQNENFNLENGSKLYPPVPNSFMEPPGFATSDYQLFQKPVENLENVKKKQKENNENYYKNHRMNEDEEGSVQDFDDRSPYIREHAPENDSEESSEFDADESEEEQEDPEEISEVSKISPDGDRVDFQIQNHNGPKTYIFGFDTGDGGNRQFRLEEKLKDGTVKGEYGYYDARGKLRAIKYEAKPLEGYEETNNNSSIPSTSNEPVAEVL